MWDRAEYLGVLVLDALLSSDWIAVLGIAQQPRAQAVLKRLTTFTADTTVTTADILEFATVCEGLQDELGEGGPVLRTARTSCTSCRVSLSRAATSATGKLRCFVRATEQ
jgi:hypothetical protein